jgi:hypothetical protein
MRGELLAWGAVLVLASGVRADTRAIPESGAPPAAAALGPAWGEDAFVLKPAQTEFALTWRGFQWGSARVYQDGRPLKAGADFTVDSDRGTLHLVRPAPSGALLEARYRLRPFLSERARPVLAEGTGRGPARRTAAAAVSPRQLLARISLPDATALAHGDDRLSPGAVPDDLRTQILSGLRRTELGEQLAGAGRNSGAFSYFRADPLEPQSASTAREEFDSRISLGPDNSSHLSLDNYLSRGSIFAEAYEEDERERLQYDHAWGSNAMSVLWEHRRSVGTGFASSRDALSLTLSRAFSHSLTADGLVSYQNSLFRGPEVEGLVTFRQALGSRLEAQGSTREMFSASGPVIENGLTLFARPGRASEATVEYQQSSSRTDGRMQRLSGEVNAALSSRLQVNGQAAQYVTEKYGNIQTLDGGVTVRPHARTVLEAAFSESTGSQLGKETAETLRLAMNPSSALKVRLGYDLLDSTQDGASQNALWSVAFGGQRYVKLEGYSNLHLVTAADAYRDALYRVEVRPAPALALSGSLRQVAAETTSHSLAGVQASLHLFKSVELTGGYRRPATLLPQSPDLIGRDVKLTLAPVSAFRLFGEYSDRPEDERGSLLDQTHRTLGLETRLGFFSVLGSLTDMTGPLAPEPGRRSDFLASLQFGKSTRLYGGLRSQYSSPLDPQSSRIYRLGITQSAGPSLFLLLEGQLGFLEDGAGQRTFNPDEARAQAKLGLRF